MERQPSAHALPHPALHARPSILDVIRCESIRIHNLPCTVVHDLVPKVSIAPPFLCQGKRSPWSERVHFRVGSVCRVHLGMGGLNQTKGSPWSEEVHFRVGSVFRVHLRVRKANSNQGLTLE